MHCAFTLSACKVPAMMTESVLAGPNFSVISCLCLWTARWSSLVNLYKATQMNRWITRQIWPEKERGAFQDLRAETHFQRKKREWHWQDLSFETDIVGQRGLNNDSFSPNPCSSQSLWGIGCNYTVSKTYSGDGFLFHSWPLCPSTASRLTTLTFLYTSVQKCSYSITQ